MCDAMIKIKWMSRQAGEQQNPIQQTKRKDAMERMRCEHKRARRNDQSAHPRTTSERVRKGEKLTTTTTNSFCCKRWSIHFNMYMNSLIINKKREWEIASKTAIEKKSYSNNNNSNHDTMPSNENEGIKNMSRRRKKKYVDAIILVNEYIFAHWYTNVEVALVLNISSSAFFLTISLSFKPMRCGFSPDTVLSSFVYHL